MAPSKKRAVVDHKAIHRRRIGPHACPCLERLHSDGICELCVWKGTMIEPDVARTNSRLLHRNMHVVKYKDLTCESFAGLMYLTVQLRWLFMFALFVAIYLLVVGLFALLFAACDVDSSIQPITARDYFNLSLQTMSTVGFGIIFPKDACANWVTVIESFVSMITISLMTGIAFVKFARPRSLVVSSHTFTVSQREGGPNAGLEIRFRVVNGTRRDLIMKGEILEVSFKLILMRVEATKTGEKKLCYYDLPLKTTSYITLRLEADIIHEIEDDSPFYGMTEEDFAKSDFLIVLMMAGVDETLHDTVHKQFEYTYENMRWGAKFVPVVAWDRTNNCVELDFKMMSRTVPAPIGSTVDLNNVEIVMDNDGHNRTLSTQTEGNMDMADEIDDPLEHANDSVHGNELNPLHSTRLLLSPQNGETKGIGVDYSDLESMVSYRDDSITPSNAPDNLSDVEEVITTNASHCSEDDDQKSTGVASTNTNSGSENNERHETTPMGHVRFDRRNRSSSIRLPRVSRRRRHDHLLSRRHKHRHPHGIQHDLREEPMSILRRRVQFKNYPFSRLSKGLYYIALETSWFRLFVYLAVIYFSSIAIIALLLHWTSRHAVVNATGVDVANNYERVFFFCAQTLSTIGYGSLAPNPGNDFVNFYVCVLAIAGAVVSTLVTGLAWAKFSIPSAKTIAFSDNLLLTAFHSHRAIMFRAANSRTYGAIIECSFRVSVVILNQRLGHKETHELKLVRNVWPVVHLATTVTHIIDEDSPLYNIPTDELLSGSLFFVVLFSGLDLVVGDNMFSRKTYHSCDILVGHHFVDNIKLTAEGVHVDLEALNDTTLTPEIDLRESRLYLTDPTPSPTTESPMTSDVDLSRPVEQAFFIEPYETQRRRRRQADEDDSIDLTPRAAQYALM